MKLALSRRRFSATGGAELYFQRLLQALAIEDKVNGTILDDPSDPSVVRAIAYWRSRRLVALPTRWSGAGWSLEGNVSETLAILELAAKEKAG